MISAYIAAVKDIYRKATHAGQTECTAVRQQEGRRLTSPRKASWVLRNLQRSRRACTTGCFRASSASSTVYLCLLMSLPDPDSNTACKTCQQVYAETWQLKHNKDSF